MNKPILYTLGHSTHPIEYFISLLIDYNIDCVVDVRSVAASRFNPQFNKKSLSRSLEAQGIMYWHLGDEFGARQTDLKLLDSDGFVDFNMMRTSEQFQLGLKKIARGIVDGHTIGLMCSEADPLHCHRFAMISPALTSYDVRHILKDKSFLTQQQLEETLVKMYSKKLKSPEIFEVFDPLTSAYRLLNKSMAYSPTQSKPIRKKGI